MNEYVQDVDRPDKDGTPPKMQALKEQVQQALQGLTPYLHISTSDNLCSTIEVRGSFEPKADWVNGIFFNSPYFLFFIQPKNKRYYDEGDTLTLELTSNGTKKKFRKYPSPDLNKIIAKLKEWLTQDVR